MIESSIETRPIYVIDDQQAMRDSIKATLDSVGCDTRTYASASRCLDAIAEEAPACIVVDLLMPSMTGLQFCRKLLAVNTDCAVVMISAHGDVTSAIEAMKLGVFDFLVKPFSREQLLNAVNRGIAQAEAWQRASQEEEAVAQRISELSTREREVLECMADGLVTKQIATKLGISPRTVDVHRSNITQKLNIDSPMQLAHVMLLEHRRQERLEILPKHRWFRR